MTPRENAAALIAALGATSAAEMAGSTRQMMSAIAGGTRAPGAPLAARIAEAAVKLPSLAERPVARPPRPGKGTSTLDRLNETVALIDAELPHVAATVKANLLRTRSETLNKILAREELTTAEVVRSRVWRELIEAFRPVMAKHPAAAADFAEVLSTLEGR
jgi:hypothetical protein